MSHLSGDGVGRPQAASITIVHHGYRFTVTIEPDNHIPPETEKSLTVCECDIIEVVATAGKPLTRPKIMDALIEQNCLHGESTIARALAHLVKRGRLAHDPKKRNGYWVPCHCSSDGLPC